MRTFSFTRKTDRINGAGGNKVLAAHINELQEGIELLAGDANAGLSGLASPNPGLARLLPTPRAMADPPDVTPGVSGGSTVITDSVLYGPTGNTKDVFAFFGCPAVASGTFPNGACYSPTNAIADGDLNVAGNFAVEFEWYGSEFELMMKGNGANYILMVDGEYDTRAGREDTAIDGALWLIHYDFGTTDFRRIRFELTSTFFFGGIRIGPTDSIWKSSRPRGPKVIVTGDSFTEFFSHWPQAMGWLLGWPDVSIVGKGSTGYLDENAGGDTYRDRAQKDIYDQNPDIVIVSGGLNDSALDAEDVGAEAATFYQEIKAELPNAVVIVSGFNQTKGTPGLENWVLVRDAIREAAEEYADAYIEMMGGPYPYSEDFNDYIDAGWMTGAGNDTAESGSGNSDLFVSSDAVHPSQLGMDYRGWRHAQAIAAAMPIGSIS